MSLAQFFSFPHFPLDLRVDSVFFPPLQTLSKLIKAISFQYTIIIISPLKRKKRLFSKDQFLQSDYQQRYLHKLQLRLNEEEILVCRTHNGT